MDQLKPILAGLKKHHFWILSVLTTLLFIGVWFMVTSDLKATTLRQKQEVEAKWTAAEGVRRDSPLPNQYSHDKMDGIVAQTAQELARAWTKQYDEQRQVLVWPRELTDEFIAAVDPLRPIEKAVPYEPSGNPPTDPRKEIAPKYRELYHNYIDDVLPKLADILGARWTAKRAASGARAGGGMMGGMGTTDRAFGSDESGATGFGGVGTMGSDGRPMIEQPPIVNWSSRNQSELLNTHFNWTKVPTTLEILYAQETLWVLEAILRAIQRTNGDIDANYQAAIKDIDEILLGRPALGRRGQITQLKAAAPPGGSGMRGDGGESGMMGEAMPTDSTMMDMMGDGQAAAQSADPADGRYVDDQYQPLATDRLRAAIASDARDPNNASIVVAKRMPVRIRVKMDQRKLSRFLAECGNAELPIEIRQVRINKTGGVSRAGAGGGFGMPGMGGDESESPSMGFGGMGMGTGGGSGVARTISSTSPFDIPIEIFGVVYLYNPVNIAKLGIDQIDSQTAEKAAASDAPAAPASVAPPAPPAPVNAVPEENEIPNDVVPGDQPAVDPAGAE